MQLRVTALILEDCSTYSYMIPRMRQHKLLGHVLDQLRYLTPSADLEPPSPRNCVSQVVRKNILRLASMLVSSQPPITITGSVYGCVRACVRKCVFACVWVFACSMCVSCPHGTFFFFCFPASFQLCDSDSVCAHVGGVFGVDPSITHQLCSGLGGHVVCKVHN